ncbi:PDDEXK nuclease domain-containing protein [Emticicia sp. SJ17W-69]|uniref:PDDEXK nuclease domain-containing protein n=1 Tax=Emticicia sp. SJ17W-69 TaxID=3421657 RepID=UPI003EBC5228
MSDNQNNTQFDYILALIQEAKNRVYQTANHTQILLYWHIGEYVHQRLEKAEWGNQTVEKLADYIQQKDPLLTNFTKRGLYRMRQFYEAYPDNEFVSTLSTQISWSHHLEILSATKSLEEREFYIRLVLKDRLNIKNLRRQLKTALFERSIIADKLLPTSLQTYPKDVTGVFKDSYVLEFMKLPENHSEKDLQKALIKNLKTFIMELGSDFSFVGEEFRLQIDMEDFYIDLLFYHRELCCLVAFELKIEKFSPSHLGQLNFYLEALDKEIKKPHENPSIGILLCKTKSKTVVEYALNRNVSPALVIDYSTKLIDKQLLQAKVQELFELQNL